MEDIKTYIMESLNQGEILDSEIVSIKFSDGLDSLYKYDESIKENYMNTVKGLIKRDVNTFFEKFPTKRALNVEYCIKTYIDFDVDNLGKEWKNILSVLDFSRLQTLCSMCPITSGSLLGQVSSKKQDEPVWKDKTYTSKPQVIDEKFEKILNCISKVKVEYVLHSGRKPGGVFRNFYVVYKPIFDRSKTSALMKEYMSDDKFMDEFRSMNVHRRALTKDAELSRQMGWSID